MRESIIRRLDRVSMESCGVILGKDSISECTIEAKPLAAVCMTPPYTMHIMQNTDEACLPLRQWAPSKVGRTCNIAPKQAPPVYR